MFMCNIYFRRSCIIVCLMTVALIAVEEPRAAEAGKDDANAALSQESALEKAREIHRKMKEDIHSLEEQRDIYTSDKGIKNCFSTHLQKMKEIVKGTKKAVNQMSECAHMACVQRKMDIIDHFKEILASQFDQAQECRVKRGGTPKAGERRQIIIQQEQFGKESMELPQDSRDALDSEFGLPDKADANEMAIANPTAAATDFDMNDRPPVLPMVEEKEPEKKAAHKEPEKEPEQKSVKKKKSSYPPGLFNDYFINPNADDDAAWFSCSEKAMQGNTFSDSFGGGM